MAPLGEGGPKIHMIDYVNGPGGGGSHAQFLFSFKNIPPFCRYFTKSGSMSQNKNCSFHKTGLTRVFANHVPQGGPQKKFGIKCAFLLTQSVKVVKQKTRENVINCHGPGSFHDHGYKAWTATRY